MMKSMNSDCKRELDLSVVQLTALMVLKETPGCQMKELAGALMLDKSAVTGLTKRLQNKGLIERVPSESDSRASILNLNEKGLEKLSEGMKQLAKANQVMDEGFSEEELGTVSRYLNHLTTAFAGRN